MPDVFAAHGSLDEIEDIARGFWYSRLVLTAVELDVFTVVGVDGACAVDVACRTHADPRATEMLLNALVALKLLGKEDGCFVLTELARRHLVAGAPEDARAVFLYQAQLWSRWAELTTSVRTGAAAQVGDPGGTDDSGTRTFIGAMHRFAEEQAGAFAGEIELCEGEHVLDLGGGSGAYAIAFCRLNPGVRATVFDQPSVVGLAREYIAAAGLSDRIGTREGNLVDDDIGLDYDLVWLSNVAHCMAPEDVQAAFRKVHAALRPGGRLVVRDFILDASKTSPGFAAIFSLNMLVATNGGASYSGDEYESWLTAAGFGSVEPISVSGAGNATMLLAHRP